jgi:hypothetical protein
MRKILHRDISPFNIWLYIHKLESATVPFASLLVDLIMDLPPSGGFDSIMVVVDHGLMKGVIITPCLKTITSEGVAKLFFKHVYRRFGLYDKIISD